MQLSDASFSRGPVVSDLQMLVQSDVLGLEDMVRLTCHPVWDGVICCDVGLLYTGTVALRQGFCKLPDILKSGEWPKLKGGRLLPRTSGFCHIGTPDMLDGVDWWGWGTLSELPVQVLFLSWAGARGRGSVYQHLLSLLTMARRKRNSRIQERPFPFWGKMVWELRLQDKLVNWFVPLALLKIRILCVNIDVNSGIIIPPLPPLIFVCIFSNV